MACCCLHKHVLKIASRPCDFSNRSSNYKSYQFGPRSAFRTPPPIPCPMPSMNSLWPATFWVSGRQTFFASSFLHAEKTTAKSADGHVWVLGGCLPLPIQSLANSPQKPPPLVRGDPFQDPTACCFDSKAFVPKLQIRCEVDHFGVALTAKHSGPDCKSDVRWTILLLL